ncbi:MAG: hypothetical protein JXM70_01225, partial [Pirellulales bacterium]|nr:hypothetical protein [Pirellulales bacterium]
MAESLLFKKRMLGELVERVPEVMKGYDSKTGHFMSGRAWDQRGQRHMYPLAIAYSTKTENNPYYRDPKLLGVIVKAGDALVEAQDEQGRWLFTKSDGSVWGRRWQEWTYSRWVDTFEIIRDDM